jgi:flagellar motor switch protein FliM
MLEPIREKLSAGYQSDRDDVDQRWMQRFRTELTACPVELKVELGRGTITVGDLSKLTTGDVLLLDGNVHEEIHAAVEGSVKFRGHPGLSKGNVAFQITSAIREEGEKKNGTKRTG